MSRGRINLAESCSASIDIRDIARNGMLLVNSNGAFVMILGRSIPSHNASLEVGRDVLVQERCASADDFAACMKAYIATAAKAKLPPLA